MDDVLNVEQAADFVRLSKSTIYRLCYSGRLTHIKKSFGIRFYKQDLRVWLDKGRKEAPQYFDSSKDSLTKPPSVAIDKAKGGVSLAKVKKLTFAKNGEILNGTVYQRKTKRGKRWCINFIGPDGNRIRRVARLAQTEEEAMIVLQEEVQKAFDREYSVRREREKVKFREFTSTYIENYAKLKKRSWISDQKYLKSQIIPFFGEMELSEISPLHVNKFMVKRQGDGVKNSTINRELTVLKKMLNLAIEWQFDIKVNPVKKGNFFSEEEFKRDRVLSYEEEKKLFETVAPHLKPILTCALTTGMRYSEILGLTWENCDLENRRIVINAKSNKSGKQRIIPINDTLFTELVKLRELNQRKGDFVFIYQDPGTGKMRPVKTVRHAFKNACRRAGIKDMRFHDLRHVFGSRLISRGADPVSVKDLLGHANLKTTEVYLHSSMKRMREAVALLDKRKAKNLEELSPLCHRFKDVKKRGLLNAFFSVN
jgi:excisionase family DNA binding protein